MDECLVRVRADGTTLPMFIAHGMQCDPLFAVHLARHLNEDLPIYALRGQGLGGRSLPLRRIEDIAARFIQAIRKVRRSGPYVLAGFCAGGHIAMEMAHQLLAEGNEVPHLFLINTPAAANPDEIERFVAQAVAVAARRLVVSEQARRHLVGAPATVSAFGEALTAYKRKPYSGKVHLLASQQRVESMQRPDRGWMKFIPAGSALRIVAPTNDGIMQQGLPAIARYMHERLASADFDGAADDE